MRDTLLFLVDYMLNNINITNKVGCAYKSNIYFACEKCHKKLVNYTKRSLTNIELCFLCQKLLPFYIVAGYQVWIINFNKFLRLKDNLSDTDNKYITHKLLISLQAMIRNFYKANCNRRYADMSCTAYKEKMIEYIKLMYSLDNIDLPLELIL